MIYRTFLTDVINPNGSGDDTITLRDWVQTVVYRFDSSKTGAAEREGEWVTIQGDDIINAFERGVDKLLFVDTNFNCINSVTEFLENFSLKDATSGAATNIVDIKMLADV